MLLILIRTGILYLLLSVLLRGMGKRQIGQMEVGEIITAFLLSEVIALPIANTNLSLLAGIIPALFCLYRSQECSWEMRFTRALLWSIDLSIWFCLPCELGSRCSPQLRGRNP